MDQPEAAPSSQSGQSGGWPAQTAANAASTSVTPSPATLIPVVPGSTDVPDIRSTSLYLNRELSWLEFNARVLAEADSEAVPLLERLKFHAIVSANLDEFFMVRVAGLKQQLTGEVDEMGPDGMTVNEQLAAISSRVHALMATQSRS